MINEREENMEDSWNIPDVLASKLDSYRIPTCNMEEQMETRFKHLPMEQLEKILSRTQGAGVQLPRDWRLTLSMDLAAANAHCPLDVEKLLSFPDMDFFHDVFGIMQHMDRETGELMHCFLPRCARKDSK